MGGLDTEITDATTTVVLEIAWFQPLTRDADRGAPRAALRGVGAVRARLRSVHHRHRHRPLRRTVARDVSRSRRASRDRRRAWPGLPPEQRQTDVRIQQVNRILGTSLVADDLPPLLDPIGYTVSGDGDTRTVALPSWRPDSVEEIDVVEEVARHYGYDRVGKTLPTSIVHGGLTVRQQRRRLLRQVLLGLGISEAMPNPFLAPDTQAKAGIDDPVITITNPLVEEESVLRTSLRPGLLSAIAFNESHRRFGARLFEIGHVYPPGKGELPDEYEALCVVLAGEEAPAAMAVWREISSALGVGARVDQGRVPAGLHATRSATLQAGKDPTGAVGEVDPSVLERFGVSERVAILELDLDQVLGREPKPAAWKPVSRYPSSDLDLAFVLRR